MSSSASNIKTASAPDSLFTATLEQADPDIAAAIRGELGRQRHEIELIASENIVSRAVLEAQGSVMTNKYAEGYPGNRYYGGCEWVDVAETLAIDRAKKLFGAQFANVQPNSGSQMNQAAFLALLQPGDTFMGLDLVGSRQRPVAFPWTPGARLAAGMTKLDSSDRVLLFYESDETRERLHKSVVPNAEIADGAAAAPLDFCRLNHH